MFLRPVFVVLTAAALLAACSTGPAEHRTSSGTGVYESPDLPGPAFNEDWVRQGVTDQQRARDTEDCYYSSRAMIAHDQAIETDRYSGRDRSVTSDTRAFQKRLNRWEEQNRQVDLFNDCMEAKGYVRSSDE